MICHGDYHPLKRSKDITPPLLFNTAAVGREPLSVGEALTRAGQVADFCAANAARIDEDGAVPIEEFRRLAAAGLLAVPLDASLGGAGLGVSPGRTLALLSVLEQVGRGNLAVGRIYEGHVNALQLIQIFGSREQQSACAAAVHGGKIYNVWNTEDEDGTKIVPLPGDRYRLEGAKTFASGTGLVERPIIGAARPDGGWQMVIVPMELYTGRVDPDWWQPLGMRASASFKVDFSGIELGEDALLGVRGDYLRQPWLTAGVVRFAAVQLGGAAALLDCTREHLRNRGWQEHPYQRERMARAAIAVEGGRLWLQGAAERIDRWLDNPAGPAGGEGLVAYANMVRTAVEAACQEVVQLAAKSVGARCLLRPHPVERIVRDLTLYLRQPAPDAALAQLGTYVIEQNAPIQALWHDGRH
ncbi:glr3048 [Gloeobacter violaceus PCC 7421]|uniref:Glr3048 protein n=1 Tax=Gloeobacter violaceus (strain ATCC 29082 / PCC 7421) TaxID=251221 RepID=Q7NCD1_GLOVI|nr:glr3048 [Gloeobacter violaceus PCC 7421]